jgi:prepilin-type N-terminal cleavage/methylation domain-containing protein
MGREGKAGNEAFTLIELVMVILLIGILAAVVLPKFVNLTGSANKAASQGVVGSLGEGVTSQMSKDLVNNDLSSYIAVTGFTKTGAGTIKFAATLPAANVAGTNPYANPFLLLPNYSTPTAAAGYGSGTSYNIVTTAPTVPIAATGELGNSWYLDLDYANGTVTGPGTVAGLTAGFTCDNGNKTGPASTVNVPLNEYTEQIANIDYIYSNGSTEDSYVYYIVVSGNNNIEGLYMVPCQ